MPSDNFEKSLRQRFQGVEVPPRPEVWDSIHLNLAKPKWHQKRGFWTLIAIGLLMLSFSAFWWINSSPTTPLTQELDSIAQLDPTKNFPQGISDDRKENNKSIRSLDTENTFEEKPSVLEGTEMDKIAPNGGKDSQFSLKPSRQMALSSLKKSALELPTTSNSLENSPTPLGQANLSTTYLPIPFLEPVDLEGYSHEMVLEGSTPLLGMDQLAGSPLPGPSKWAISFYVRPELPWYTSASISLEQDPPRTAEVDFPPDVAVSEPEFGELVVGQDRPSLVFYEINYARSGLSTGLTLGYYMNPQLSIHTGVGIFASGKHRLSPVSGTRPDSANFSTNNSPTSDFSMQNFQLEVPILAQYTFASDRSSWLIQGGVSLNTSLNKLEFNFDNNESGFRSLGANPPPLIQKSSHLHAELGIMYRFHLNSKLNLYLGPSQTYGLSPVYQTLQGKNIYLNRLSLRMGIEFR